MDRFKELTTFVEVAQRGSLSAAAREEGITPAMVGRRIDQLEERLGVKLFKRSTRKVTLTPEGSTFYEDCHRLLDELRSAEDALSVGAKSASGLSTRAYSGRRGALTWRPGGRVAMAFMGGFRGYVAVYYHTVVH